MKQRFHQVAVILLMVIIGLVAPLTVALADVSPALKQMATIMYRLKHYPSPQGKQELQQIINDAKTTANEKVLATAMFNLQHHAMDADKVKLKVIMQNKSASADERDLASIIYNLNHRPTDDDKVRLKKMMH